MPEDTPNVSGDQPLVPIVYAHPEHADTIARHLAANVGIGPECDPNVRTAVLANAGGALTAGQVIQYLQIKHGALQLCTVTVQPGEERPAR